MIKQTHIDYLAKLEKDGKPRKGGSLKHLEPSVEFKDKIILIYCLGE